LINQSKTLPNDPKKKMQNAHGPHDAFQSGWKKGNQDRRGRFPSPRKEKKRGRCVGVRIHEKQSGKGFHVKRREDTWRYPRQTRETNHETLGTRKGSRHKRLGGGHTDRSHVTERGPRPLFSATKSKIVLGEPIRARPILRSSGTNSVPLISES